jgi:hypothetical protein
VIEEYESKSADVVIPTNYIGRVVGSLVQGVFIVHVVFISLFVCLFVIHLFPLFLLGTFKTDETSGNFEIKLS